MKTYHTCMTTVTKLTATKTHKKHALKQLTCTAFVLLCLVPLVGCGSSRFQQEQGKVDTLPEVDTSKPEGFLERFKPHDYDTGGWLEFEETGSYFKAAKRQHPDSALVYFYRPDSRWSQQEVVAASVFLNGKRLRSLKNNHYYPIEMPAGTYRLAIRRPLPPVYFQKGTVVDFQVEAGKTYYLKYAEQYHVSPPDKSLGLLFARPLMQMPEKQALKEISSTRLKTLGYTFTNNPNFVAASLPSVTGTKTADVTKDSLSEQKNNQVKQKFKFHNPLTW